MKLSVSCADFGISIPTWSIIVIICLTLEIIVTDILMEKQVHLQNDFEHSDESSTQQMDKTTEEELVARSAPYKPKWMPTNIIIVMWIEVGGFYGLFLMLTKAKLSTIIWTIFLTLVGSLGNTMGVHRFYAHQTFKANKWFELILAASYSIFPQRSIWRWVIDHRQHHKYSDTDADPHNSKRGFLFSHIGWLTLEQHPEVFRTKRTINVSDLQQNPIVMFQKKYYYWILILMTIILPTIVPYYFWNEDLSTSFFVCVNWRYFYCANLIGMVNSVAHLYGVRPFNKKISSFENLFVSIFAFGEGWHNYHHTFPWDYRASERGQSWNFTTRVIDFCAKRGWVYDLKEASPDLVKKYCTKHGDGSHPVYGKFVKSNK